MLTTFIVENHDEALPVLYKAIGCKLLPLSDSVLVHFDSHPDLLIPKDLHADDIFDKLKLFELVSIENWILPAVFAGHFSEVVWIKPPWSEQIPEGYYQFYIGKHKTTGKIRVTSKLPYFVGETLFTQEDNLVDKRMVSLYVVDIESWRKLLRVPLDKQVPLIVRQNSLNQRIQEHDLIKRGNSGCRNPDEPPDKKACVQSEPQQFENRRLHGNVNNVPVPTQTHQVSCRGDGDNQTIPVTSDNTDSRVDIDVVHIQTASSHLTDESCDSEHEIDSCDESQSNDDSFLTNPKPKQTHFLHSPEWLTLLSLLSKKPFVLDIDLDFFSTQDPFRSQFTERQYSLLKSIYAFEKPLDNSDQSVVECLEHREKQLKELADCYTTLKENGTVKHQDEEKQVLLTDLIAALYANPPEGITSPIDTNTIEASSETGGKKLSGKGGDGSTTCVDGGLAEKAVAGKHNVKIDFDWLHEIGSGCDDTELPHHVSSTGQIEELVCSVEDVVGTLPDPKIITVARSSEDDYCPKFQVEKIQQLTLDMLSRLYPHSRVVAEYIIDASPETATIS